MAKADDMAVCSWSVPTTLPLLFSTACPLYFPGCPRVSRTCWMRVISKDCWERLVRREFSDGRWRESFQMMRRSFDKLAE